MDGLTGFQRDLLYVILAENSPHGLEIKDRLDEYYTERVTRGRVYANLDELVDEGYIEKGSKDPRSNCYSLTASGLATIVAHRQWTERQLQRRIESAVGVRGLSETRRSL